ncbi:hypothetical protein C6A85_90815, partial [Mycobacterium sp. ITM-2017-0098]
KALRRDIMAVLNEPRYREASRRVASDMAAAPGFDGLAGVVDRVIIERTSACKSSLSDDNCARIAGD